MSDGCSVEGCGHKVLARGWCSPHYHRWRRHGSPHIAPNKRTLRERLLAMVEVDAEGCWVWQGSRERKGYGRFRVGGRHGKSVMAHRLSYELHVGPIPEGKVLDHLCRNPSCINPEHLEPVTNAENCRRGLRGKLGFEKAAEIRSLALAGWLQSDIAEAFGTTQTNVSRIKRGESWATV